MDFPAGLVATLAKGLQEAETVLVIEVNILATVAAIYYVVDGSWILEAQRTA